MGLSLGSTSIGEIYLGSTKIGEAYLGSTLVYSASAPSNVVTIGGKDYPYARMPDGRDWIIYNLDYAPAGISVSSSLTYRSSGSYTTATYYNYDQTTYGWGGLKYGLLYNFNAVSSLNRNKASLFPGWHVPTLSECQALSSAVNGKAKSLRATGWNSGDGTTDFNALPSGTTHVVSGGSVTWSNTNAYVAWSNSTSVFQNKNENVMGISGTANTGGISIQTGAETSAAPRNNYYYSVRLIKDV